MPYYIIASLQSKYLLILIHNKDSMEKQIRLLVISNYNKTHSNKRAESDLLVGLVQRGVEVTIMTYGRNSLTDFLESKGLNFIFHHPRKKISFRSIKIIRNTLIDGGFNILKLYNGRAVTNGILAARGLDVKIVSYYGSMRIYWHDPSAYLSYLNPRIDRIICISKAVTENLSNQLPRSRKHVPVKIYKGYSSAWTLDISALSRKELGIPEDAFLIGCIAGIRKEKGLVNLLKAIRMLPPGLPVYFIIIGYKANHPRHLAIIKDSAYSENVQLLGLRENALEYIAACDLYIQPSLSEGLGRAIMEAMLIEVPCVVTDYGGAKELVEEGKTGYIIRSGSVSDIAEVLQEAYSERDKLKETGKKARLSIINNFNVEQTIEQAYNLYTGLV